MLKDFLFETEIDQQSIFLLETQLMYGSCIKEYEIAGSHIYFISIDNIDKGSAAQIVKFKVAVGMSGEVLRNLVGEDKEILVRRELLEHLMEIFQVVQIVGKPLAVLK